MKSDPGRPSVLSAGVLTACSANPAVACAASAAAPVRKWRRWNGSSMGRYYRATHGSVKECDGANNGANFVFVPTGGTTGSAIGRRWRYHKSRVPQ